MRQISSGCLCRSAERPAWNGGSNQNQRSVGNSAVILTSAIRNWSSNTCPAKSAPTICRSDDRAPSQATTYLAPLRRGPRRVPGHDIAGPGGVGPPGRIDRNDHTIVTLFQRDRLVAAAQGNAAHL